MAKTLFIVNPHAGRTRKIWREILPRLKEWVSDYTIVMTHHHEDVLETLAQARIDEIKRVITVGGDGTNKFMLNALMTYRESYPEHELIFGTIPAGTGRDFVRGAGLTLNALEAAEYLLKKAQVRTIDIGRATFAGESHYFLNVANAGIANDVAQRVERSSKRPWTTFVTVIRSLASYEPEAVRIELDGENWFEGNIYVIAVANGKYTGQGMLIAPDALIDDGFFDVVIAEKMSLFDLVQTFPKIFSGKHITHPKVKFKRAKQVRIISQTGKKIGMDLDGEPSDGALEISYELIPASLKILL